MLKRVFILFAICTLAGFLLAPAAADAAKSKGKNKDEKHHKDKGKGKDNGIAHRVAALEALVSSQAGLVAALQGELAAHSASVVHHARYTDAEAVAAVGPHTAPGSSVIDDYVTVDTGTINGLAGPHVIFTGANLHVRSGAGTTDAAVNGLGNFIVGYNENNGTQDKSGSHNIVVGPFHAYSSYGGLVAGESSSVLSPYATVSGGKANTASGDYSSVSGGSYNTASGLYASVSGGQSNTASAYSSSVSGGSIGTASSDLSSVSGGFDNTASGVMSSVSGGARNTASGFFANVSGGSSNIASGDHSRVGGGLFNEASGNRASVSGGRSRVAIGVDDWAAGGLFQDQ